MLFKADTQHALRALAVLAGSARQVSTTRLAREIGASEPALAKVLQRLAQQGILAGRPGPGGGYVLSRPAADVSLWELVTLFEGPNFGRACIFGLPRCSGEGHCPLHDEWQQIRGRLMRLLEQGTLAALADGAMAPGRGPRP